MPHPLSVVILQSAGGDTGPILQALAGAGFEPNVREAHDANEFRAALESPPQLILAGAGWPAQESLRALRYLHRHGLDVPFLLLTSAAEADTAVRAMRLGASDCVFTDHLDRLGPAVQRALRHKQQRAARRGERAALELSLQQGLRLGDEALTAVNDGVVVADARDPSWPILYVNPAFERLTGYTAAEMLGKDFRAFYKTSTDVPVLNLLHEAAVTSVPFASEMLSYRKDGSSFWGALALAPVRAEQGEVDQFIAVLQDVTARKQAEEEQARLVSLLEASPDLVASFNLDGIIRYINRAGRKLLGFIDVDTLPELMFSECQPRWAWTLVDQQGIPTAIREGTWTGETALVGRDGREIPVMQVLVCHRTATGQPSHFSTMARDLTAIKGLEQQFRQAQKMEAVGRLAAGVAHDFNNLLTIISGYSALLLNQPPRPDGGKSYLEQIKQAGERATALTHQLLAFSRKQILHPEVVDLNALMRRMETMLRRLLGEDVRLTTVLAPELGTVKADPGQLEQVVMNLAINARDAMPQGGKLTIETRNLELDASHQYHRPEIRPGPYVQLSVTDTGCGMTNEVKSHLFEPFYTTKEPGKGTGLGLATVYGIVKQSGGYVYVFSEPGRGATFTIYMPRLPAEAGQEVPTDAAYPSGTETILIAEDMPEVRQLARTTLAQRGYQILEAVDGRAALELAAGHPGTIHLLLTDMVMPAMSGRELAERLQAVRPELKVLYMSGYPDEAVSGHGVLTARMEFLQKPFSPLLLLRKVREVLDAGTAAAMASLPGAQAE